MVLILQMFVAAEWVWYVCRKPPSIFPVKNEIGISYAKIEGRFTSLFFSLTEFTI